VRRKGTVSGGFSDPARNKIGSHQKVRKEGAKGDWGGGLGQGSLLQGPRVARGDGAAAAGTRADPLHCIRPTPPRLALPQVKALEKRLAELNAEKKTHEQVRGRWGAWGYRQQGLVPVGPFPARLHGALTRLSPLLPAARPSSHDPQTAAEADHRVTQLSTEVAQLEGRHKHLAAELEQVGGVARCAGDGGRDAPGLSLVLALAWHYGLANPWRRPPLPPPPRAPPRRRAATCAARSPAMPASARR
jgi:hypothetical protein